MKRILLSWIAAQNDFENEQVSVHSPNYNIHKYHFKQDVHYLFISSEDEFLQKAELLRSRILCDFPNRRIEIIDLRIKDPINVREIKDAVQYFLISRLKDDINTTELTAYISPGTSSMQVVWYLMKLSIFPKMMLVQGRKAIHTKNNIPFFEAVDLVDGNTTMSLVTKEIISSSYSEKYPVHYKSISKVYDDAGKIANAPYVSALIMGSTGTGKENLAAYIHNNSSNKEGKFLAINCSAFSDNLLESRLFGYEKGAFTGALQKRTGIFEDADGGTVFLDEIGDISPYMQQSLLRVLQEKEVMPVGSSKVKKVNFRLICATNKNLMKMCAEEKFRWDLYYRISTTSLKLPDLIDWEAKDKQELINYFIEKKACQFSKAKLLLSDECYKQLIDYTYPGNIRELENIIENLYVFSNGSVHRVALPELNESKYSARSLKEMEKTHIQNILKDTSYNIAKSAKILGIAVNTLKNKMEEYKIQKNNGHKCNRESHKI